MIHSKLVFRATKSLFSQPSRALSLKRKPPTPKDLDKYDVIIIGCNLGGILSRQFEKLTKKHYKVMVVFDRNINEQLAIRGVYEQGKAAKTDYLLNAKLSLDTNTAHSDGIGCEKILPEENAIILRNGRRVEYDHLVVAMGLNEDLQAIKGFEDAWQDLNHPVFCHRDHPTWRTNDLKHPRWIYNYTNGNAFFCIPPFPYKGEITSFNFFNAAEVWKWYAGNGKVSPLSKFTVVNSNNTFCQYFDVADQFIKEKLKKNGVDIELNTKLVEVDKNNFKATFEDAESGEKSVREYRNLYVIPPTKPHQSLVESGLATQESNFLLDVDRATLRHRKYKNIFGLGEVNNIPTTKGFWNGMYQLHVVKHNLNRSLHGQSLNAQFDGRTKVPLQLGQNTLTFVTHYYDQKPGRFNLLSGNGGIIAKLRYSRWARSQKKAFMGIYLGKNYGPPFYKMGVSFRGEATGTPEAAHNLAASGSNFTPVSKASKSEATH